MVSQTKSGHIVFSVQNRDTQKQIMYSVMLKIIINYSYIFKYTRWKYFYFWLLYECEVSLIKSHLIAIPFKDYCFKPLEKQMK